MADFPFSPSNPRANPSVLQGTSFTPMRRKLGPKQRNMDFSAPYNRTANMGAITQSAVNTQGPYSSSQVYQNTQARPVYPGYGAGQGDRTRQAFARAASMQDANTRASSLDKYAQAYRQKQEQTRAADIQGMREEQAARYGLDEDYVAKRRNQELQRYERMKDLRNAAREARRDRDASIFQSIGGLLLGSAMPVISRRIEQNWDQGKYGIFRPNGDGFLANMRRGLFG